MTNEKKIYKSIPGILLVIFVISPLGKIFDIYFTPSLINILGLLFAISWLYIIMGLITLKKWAWKLLLAIFSTTIAMLVFFELLLRLAGGSRINLESLPEGLLYMVFWVSLVVIPVFGISALIRKIRKDKNNK